MFPYKEIHKEDLREVILKPLFHHCGDGDAKKRYYHEDVLYAMDRYMEETVLQLLQWMAQQNVDCISENTVAQDTGEQLFYLNGEWITKEQLFENFL